MNSIAQNCEKINELLSWQSEITPIALGISPVDLDGMSDTQVSDCLRFAADILLEIAAKIRPASYVFPNSVKIIKRDEFVTKVTWKNEKKQRCVEEYSSYEEALARSKELLTVVVLF